MAAPTQRVEPPGANPQHSSTTKVHFAEPYPPSDVDSEKTGALDPITSRLLEDLKRERRKSRNKNWLIAFIIVLAVAAHFLFQPRQHSHARYLQKPEVVPVAVPIQSPTLNVLQDVSDARQQQHDVRLSEAIPRTTTPELDIEVDTADLSVPAGPIPAPALAPASRIAATSSNLQDCLNSICGSRGDCVRFAGLHGHFSYFFEWMRPLNLALIFTPTAVIRPRNVQEVSAVVKCAARFGVKVQARSGGHSYGNHGLGGKDGAISIDLENLQDVKVNTTSWRVTVGAGSKLGDVDDKLLPYKRTFPHGICPGVGIGGHAAIGGLGPSSRMWGLALDQVEEVEVVVADGRILKASATQNSDLFFALRGAAPSFGIVTSFVIKTYPEPTTVIDTVYNFQYSRMNEMVEFFMWWQALIADPKLDRRLGTEFTLHPLGARVTAAWHGDEASLRQSGILERLPNGNDSIALNRRSWIGHVLAQAQKEALRLGDVPNSFYSKSLGFTRQQLMSREEVTALFNWVDDAQKGTLAWFIIFDATGGIIQDIPHNATAYAHRDKVLFYQSYAINVLRVSSTTRQFLEEFHRRVVQYSSNNQPYPGTYPGYVDPYLKNPQTDYWGSNLPRLEEVKGKWDPSDVFHNPQSVKPRKAK